MRKMSISRPKAVNSKRQKRSFATIWRNSHSQAWHDLKTRWARGLLLAFYLCIALAAVYFLSFMIVLSIIPRLWGFVDILTACLPDRRFSLDPSSFQFWTQSGVFEITMGYGELTFTQAKVIDVIWDVIVGRGGQALLAFISGKVFTKYVTTTMHIEPITFDTFRTLFLQKDMSTVTGTSRVAHDFARRHNLTSRAAALFMIMTMIFVLAFLTAASAMTGYSPNVQAFVEDRSLSYVPFSNFQYLYYTVHDGDKISKTKDFQITSPSNYGEPVLETGAGCPDYDNYDGEQCQLLDDINAYVLKYGIEGATNNTTFFGKNSREVRPPSLNITAYCVPLSHLYVNYDSYGNLSQRTKSILTSDGRDFNLTVTTRLTWTDGQSSTFLQPYVEKHGKCQTTETYKWGFSCIQLVFMTCLLNIWLLGIYIIYIRSHVAMLKSGQDTRVAGTYVALLQLSEAVTAQVKQNCEGLHDSDLATLEEKELRKCIRKNLRGGSISYKASLLNGNQSTRAPTWSFRDWQ